MIPRTIPTKTEIEDLIRQGYSVLESAKHYGVPQPIFSNWRKLRGVKIRRKQVLGVKTINKARKDRNRIYLKPVSFPDSDAYMAMVEKGLHQLQERYFSRDTFEDFRRWLKTDAGQRFLGEHQGRRT